MILNAFETYVYLAGALAIGVLAIEVSEGPLPWLLPRSKAHSGFGADPPMGYPLPLRLGGPVGGWGPGLTSQLLLSVQLFAMIFAMCLFRGIQ